MRNQFSPKRFPITVIGPSIAYIPLSQEQYALIDFDDLSLLANEQWYAWWNPSTKSYYAVRNAPNNARPQRIYMHRVILSCRDGFVGDHRNKNTIDNRRANLRECTYAQNLCNRSAVSKTGYRGVQPTGRGYRKPFLTQITSNGKRRVVGYFDTPEEAALAYNIAAIDLHGEFATLNEVNNEQSR